MGDIERDFANAGYTLASVLRCVLEQRHPEALVYCHKPHPLDDFIRVRAPDDAAIRTALLTIRDRVAEAKRSLTSRQVRTSPRPAP